MAPLALSPDSISDRSAHRIGRSAQRSVTLWDQLATTAKIRSTEEQVQPLTVLRR